MSLFVGNLSKYVRYDDIDRDFNDVGPCKVQLKVSVSCNSAPCSVESPSLLCLFAKPSQPFPSQPAYKPAFIALPPSVAID